MLRALLCAGVFLLSLAAVGGQVGVKSDLPIPVLVLLAAAAGAAVWHAQRAWGLVAAVGALLYIGPAMWPPLVVASYVAGITLRKGRDIAAFLGGAAVVVLLSVAVGKAIGGRRELVMSTPVNAIFLALLMIVVPLLLGLWMRARSEVLAAARERAQRLEREQVVRAEQARTQERARIAREMHDVVAHRVSLMVLHAGALEMRTSDDGTAQAAALIASVGREALTNLRDVLGVLRSDALRNPQPTLSGLDLLLDQTRSFGIEVTRRDEGEIRPLSETVERTAYRVVQEALTNIRKHAGEARTGVVLRFLPAELEVSVRNAPPDDPRPSGVAPLPESGWGLIGLRERVELMGGSFRAEAGDDGGFEVNARIPA